MKLTVLGSNGTYPTPGRPASGYLLVDEGTVLWLDVGPGTLAAALEIEAVGGVDGVVISHVHPDHCVDLFMLFNVLRRGSRDRWGLPVFVPEGARDHLGSFLGADADHDFHKVFDFRTVGGGSSAALGSMDLSFGAAVHSVPALVTGISGSSRVTYSGDAGPGGDLVDVATGADLFICEATFAGEVPANRYPYHLYAAEAGAVATAAGVGSLLLTHLAPTLDPQASVAEARSTFDGPVDHARPSMEVEL